MVEFDKMHTATENDMEEMGYYGNGFLYDTEKPAKWQMAYHKGEVVILVVAFGDECWFCEDDEGLFTGLGETPEAAIRNWYENA